MRMTANRKRLAAQREALSSQCHDLACAICAIQTALQEKQQQFAEVNAQLARTRRNPHAAAILEPRAGSVSAMAKKLFPNLKSEI